MFCHHMWEEECWNAKLYEKMMGYLRLKKIFVEEFGEIIFAKDKLDQLDLYFWNYFFQGKWKKDLKNLRKFLGVVRKWYNIVFYMSFVWKKWE